MATTTTKGTERGTTTIDHVKILQEVDDETTAELYANDPGFRLSYGPSIALYGDSGMDYCLIGLEFMFDYADFGVCYGVVTGESSSLGNNNCPLLTVAWTSTTTISTGSSSSTSSKKNEKSTTVDLEGKDVVKCYIMATGASISWLTDFDESTPFSSRTPSPLLSIAPGTEMVDWEIPCSAHEMFPALDTIEDDDEKWWATFARLNDPPAATMIAPHISSYPTPFVLTMMLLVKELYDPVSTKLPTMVTPDNKQIFELADAFARELSGEDEWGQLQVLTQLVQMVREKTESITSATSSKEEEEASWREAYTFVQALILTLSDDFEGQAARNWTYVTNGEATAKVTNDLVLTIASVLLHPRLAVLAKDDMEKLRMHLRAGSFTQFILDVAFFEKDFPVAFELWGELVGSDEDDD